MKAFLLLLFSGMGLASLAQNSTITKMEYFIDTDPGVGNATLLAVPASGDAIFSFDVSLSGYPVGYHKLYIRTLDDGGNWSITARRNIEVLTSQSGNTISAGEYFIDEDPGYGAGKLISVTTSGEEILQDFSASLAALSVGYHKLYGRFRDNDGNWSQTFRRNIEVINNEAESIINGEYFFKTDNGFGAGSPVIFTSPSSDGSFTFNIPAGQIPTDGDTIFVRVRGDINSRWSLTRWAAVSTVLPLTFLEFTALKKQDIVLLQWKTTNEMNTSHFMVQRSEDGTHFTNIGNVPAKNAGGINQYSFHDNIGETAGSKIFYRLKQMDKNGDTQFSKIISIAPDHPAIPLSIYPNPFQDHITISVANATDLKGATISLTDVSGKVFFKDKLSASKHQQIHLPGLAKGLYFIQINKNSGKSVYKIMKE